uniref:Ribosomal protein S7 n=1 Tax=Phaeophyceae sp. TaxID=2249243 RepID=A0A8E5BF30_9PHAE|nr:ribosomal protein S7 [Phaeophyceae sp.]
MSRRTKIKRNFPLADSVYNSVLVSLMISKILKNGKKIRAEKIIYEAFEIIEKKTKVSPLRIFEKAIKRVSPSVQIKSKRNSNSTLQVPKEIRFFRGINLSLCWIIQFAKVRPGRTMAIKLANEIIDASRGSGNSIRKKEETHRMAKANKVFAYQNT